VVWLFGRDSVHFGASGLVYGFVSFVFVAGLLRRDRRAKTHLAAALIGVVPAIALRRLNVLRPKRYAWQDEDGETAKGDSRPQVGRYEPSPGNSFGVFLGGGVVRLETAVRGYGAPELIAGAAIPESLDALRGWRWRWIRQRREEPEGSVCARWTLGKPAQELSAACEQVSSRFDEAICACPRTEPLAPVGAAVNRRP